MDPFQVYMIMNFDKCMCPCNHYLSQPVASVSLLAKIELLPVLKKLLEITHCKSSTIIQIRGAKKKKRKKKTTWLQSDPSTILSKEECVFQEENRPSWRQREGTQGEGGTRQALQGEPLPSLGLSSPALTVPCYGSKYI